IGSGNANCEGCGSPWDAKRPAPVGSLAPNRFGLNDMHGNVWEWVEDCNHANYRGAPTNGSAWIADGDCRNRIVRGGGWFFSPGGPRAALRFGYPTVYRFPNLGFRVGRTLFAGAGASR